MYIEYQIRHTWCISMIIKLWLMGNKIILININIFEFKFHMTVIRKTEMPV